MTTPNENEHIKLKAICDKIGYTENSHPFWFKCIDTYDEIVLCDVREIIFTPEFINKLVKQLDLVNLLWDKRNTEKVWFELMLNLDNPVNYLYNLLELWNQNK